MEIQDVLARHPLRQGGESRSECAEKALLTLAPEVLKLRLMAQAHLDTISQCSGANEGGVVAFVNAMQMIVQLDTHLRDNLVE